MIVIPAIDIRQKKCVILQQGKIEKEIIYSNDPVFVAKLWQAKGANHLHIIDLDGAFCGKPQNLYLVKEIRNAFNGIIQFGGGVRSLETIEKLIEMNIDKIIIATLVVYHPKIVRDAVNKYKNKIIAAIDVVEGKVAIGGWKEVTQISAIELVSKLEDMGIKEIIVTDVAKNGSLEGPNIEDIRNIVMSTSLKVIASGGVSTIDDLIKLKELEKDGLIGVIIGKALYDDTIKFEEAKRIAENS
ncbi:MAG: 1-(5-phosphoribosyl)-5-[(5-phosphoribosylamino)methylideneamino]imidazole-4-carboxamide isomerase [Elusimicrobiota bacterium]|nr:1-(5-phosphoribosyl)-5-[(5-phosphoribosylamino)methylideneamino]imidazole-4-carboxamide isomerase [Elusimicrobiota bacterium]